ncbi:MAG TPA: tRNA pseudouridine(38-40) synthase TruA [Candidatus Limnocylindrales bacterium]|nr:tRNA pseudouridine(38-40) synthase TruA [Candidatus Limnocylindrales bacterium]
MQDEKARVRLDVSYDGTGFSGWAAQPGQRTVAGVLSAELERLFRTVEGLTVAGRTDAGVHASGQVCHVDVPLAAWEELESTGLRRLAGLLPPDVRVFGATRVPPTFDARFSAVFRLYGYRISDAVGGVEPLRRLDTVAWPRPLDVTAMNEAARALEGEHDFVAFCRRKEHATTIRTVSEFSWRRDGDGIVVASVRADAFCQQMVRSFVGSMLAVGEGRRPVGWPASLLSATERSSQVLVAPAHGLTLLEVGYPADEESYAAQAEATRRMRARA